MPIAGIAALTIAALFAGVAFYVSAVEHPARMALDPENALRQWAPSYHRGAIMQASLALAGTAAGVAAWLGEHKLPWLAGSIFMLASWPWTLLVIMPVNRRLKAMAGAGANGTARELLSRWGKLHVARTIFGIAAVLCFGLGLA
jgi:uncharacterized membrane protein